MRLKIEIDTETASRLAVEAVRHRRPVPLHAEVLLRRALGLPVPDGPGAEAQNEPGEEVRR